MIFESIKCLVTKGIISSETGGALSSIVARLPENGRDNLKLLFGVTSKQEDELMEWSDNDLVEFSDGSNVIW